MEADDAVIRAALRTGDLVLVDVRGRRFHAFVLDPQAERITLEPLSRAITYRACTPRQVQTSWRKRERRAVTVASLPLGGHAQLAMDVAPRPAAPAFAGIAAGDVVLVATADGAAAADVLEVDRGRLRVRGCETPQVDGLVEIRDVLGHFAAHRRRRPRRDGCAEQLRLT